MWGFALIELPVVTRIVDGRPSGHEDRGDYVAREHRALLRLLEQTGGPNGPAKHIPPIVRPGQPPLNWPPGTFISKVQIIRRLYGRLTYPVFQFYVELEADDIHELKEAFEYLEHYCGVEGYG